MGNRQLLINIFDEMTIKLQAKDMASIKMQAVPRPEINGWLINEGKLNKYSCNGDTDWKEIPDHSNGNMGIQANSTSSG